MQIFQVLLLLGFAMLSQAKSSAMFATHAVGVFDIKDFILNDLVFVERQDRRHQAQNCTLTFSFTDPNANTTIQCGDSWFKNATVDGTPFSYVYCQAPTSDVSIWKFDSFTKPGNFSLTLSHGFSDPVHYPPPYDYVQYFADVDIALNCNQTRASTRCYSTGPIIAEVNRISN